jgi:Fe-S-cluster-containing hydrogenase component 2
MMLNPALPDPLLSLQQGHWFKLICGASFQHLPAIRTLALVYTLAGADCIDVAADPAVIYAAREGIAAAQAIRSHPVWLMVSLNDGEDPHFRKATFDPQCCPPECPRPCVSICPAKAIIFSDKSSGVLEDRCYGCGRCLPICPIEQISTRSQVATLDLAAPLIQAGLINALELHTQVGHEAAFQKLWTQVQPFLPYLNVLSISCPEAEDVIEYLSTLQNLLKPLPCVLIWQTDGRPMSGDIGNGATRATIRYGQKALQSSLEGFIQLAGGTNDHTVPKLRAQGLLQSSQSGKVSQRESVAGIAFGSYARSLIHDLQVELEAQPLTSYCLEDYPHLLAKGIESARQLVNPLKCAHKLSFMI